MAVTLAPASWAMTMPAAMSLQSQVGTTGVGWCRLVPVGVGFCQLVSVARQMVSVSRRNVWWQIACWLIGSWCLLVGGGQTLGVWFQASSGRPELVFDMVLSDMVLRDMVLCDMVLCDMVL